MEVAGWFVGPRPRRVHLEVAASGVWDLGP
jgi:hypothetical protein